MTLLEKVIEELDALYPGYKSILKYQIIKKTEEIDSEIYKIQVAKRNQINKIKKLKELFFVRIVEENEEQITLELFIQNDIDLKKIFCVKSKEPDYDNSEELWNLRMISNKIIGKDAVTGEHYYGNKEIKLSGDIVFNFNPSKYKYFEEIIKEDDKYSDEEKKIFINMLKECSDFNHSPQNTSIILQTGGLNQFKQGLSNDRYDVFMCEIEEYYKGNKLKVLENGNCPNMSFKNRNRLESELNLIAKDEVEFAKIFYNITDENYLKDLLISGNQRIKNCKDVYRYMSLTFRYWILISTFYCSNKATKDIYLDRENSLPPGLLLLKFEGYVDVIQPLISKFKNKDHKNC